MHTPEADVVKFGVKKKIFHYHRPIYGMDWKNLYSPIMFAEKLSNRMLPTMQCTSCNPGYYILVTLPNLASFVFSTETLGDKGLGEKANYSFDWGFLTAVIGELYRSWSY